MKVRRLDTERAAQIYWLRFPEHTDPMTQGYVGFTVQPLVDRVNRHKRMARARAGGAPILNRILRRREVVAETLVIGTVDYCLEVEAKLRPAPHVGWNLCVGGVKGSLGLKRRPETVAKQNAHKIGKPRSAETRAKISAGLMGNQCAAGPRKVNRK